MARLGSRNRARRSGLAAASLVLAIALSLGAEAGTAGAGTAAAPAPEKLVFLLQYVGSDYGGSVRDGRVADPFEYEEMLVFTRALVAGHAALRGERADPEVAAGLERLRRLAVERAPWPEVRRLVGSLTPRLAAELGVDLTPVGPLDAARGRELYESSCVPCHGADGRGDGRAAAGMDPPPTSFRDPQMAHLSPHQVVGATRFGIAGTAMPSYDGVFADEDLWSLATWVWTLRSPDPVVRSGGETEVAAGAAPPTGDAAAAPPSLAPGVELARELEAAFADVADRAFPSVVTVGAWLAVDPAPASSPSATTATPGWQQAGARDDPFPGFRRVRARSGFFVADDGFLLTNFGAVEPFEGREIDLVAVEIDGRHYRARVVGTEPTVDLAVLAVDLPFGTRALELADESSVQVGRWAIALGDPPGPERAFDAGTIAARPERECYQEQRSATLVQSSCRLDPESYGGPLVDIAGRLVGMTVPRPGGGGPAGAAAFTRQAQALPNGLAMTLYEAFRAKDSRRSPWLGFSVLELDPEDGAHRSPRTGVLIDDVFRPSPAAHAGIEVGDVLTAIDDHPIRSVPEFQRWLYLSGIGTSVTLHVSREGTPLAFPVVIEERPPEARPVDPTAAPTARP